MTQIEKVTISCNFVLILRDLTKRIESKRRHWIKCLASLLLTFMCSFAAGKLTADFILSLLDTGCFDNLKLFVVILNILLAFAYIVMLHDPFDHMLHVDRDTTRLYIPKDMRESLRVQSRELTHNSDLDNIKAFGVLKKLDFMPDIIPNWKAISMLFGSDCNVFVSSTEKVADIRDKKTNSTAKLELDSVMLTKDSYTPNMMLVVGTEYAYCYDTKLSQKELNVKLIK